jgi:hypothetical protein
MSPNTSIKAYNEYLNSYQRYVDLCHLHLAKPRSITENDRWKAHRRYLLKKNK